VKADAVDGQEQDGDEDFLPQLLDPENRDKAAARQAGQGSFQCGDGRCHVRPSKADGKKGEPGCVPQLST